MEVEINPECPYCGYFNSKTVEVSPYYQVMVCDVDEGGCDKEFAFIAKVIEGVQSNG